MEAGTFRRLRKALKDYREMFTAIEADLAFDAGEWSGPHVSENLEALEAETITKLNDITPGLGDRWAGR